MNILTTDVTVVSVSDRQERVLDAAWACFLRHGIRKTTMEDIAAEAAMSRPAVYQYVRGKDDAYRRLAARLYRQAVARAEEAAAAGGTLTQRLDRVLSVRLGFVAGVRAETPHASELVGEGSRVAADLDRSFLADLVELLTRTIAAAAAEADLPLHDGNAREIAELALALTRGLEPSVAHSADPAALDLARDRLRNGIALLIAGLSAAVTPSV